MKPGFVNTILGKIVVHLSKLLADTEYDYSKLIKINNPVIFDVGANQGQNIKKFKDMFEKPRIYAFEPTPRLGSILEESYKDDSNVDVIKQAVSNINGAIKFNVYGTKETGVGNSIYELNPEYPAKLIEQIEVATVRLDSFCAQKDIKEIDILKIDVQGHEPEVLEGVSSLLSSYKVKVIGLEIMFNNTYNRSLSFYKIESILQPYGYRLYTLPLVRKLRTGKLSWVDAVYVNPELYASQSVNGR